MHGLGEFTWKNGVIYKGQYVKGQKNGFGSLIYPTAEKKTFIGRFREGRQHGYGVFRIIGGDYGYALDDGDQQKELGPDGNPKKIEYEYAFVEYDKGKYLRELDEDDPMISQLKEEDWFDWDFDYHFKVVKGEIEDVQYVEKDEENEQ